MISKEQVEHIAKLARIELTEEEKEKFTRELSSILDYVKQLKKVDTKKVESIKQVTGLENIIRGDTRMMMRIKSELDANIRDKLLKQAPSRKGDYIKVPKILE
jgi:aspartyl-tRNA(Asn)/glutamyl-tRNA(Gln) amidotransferase subunit C